MLVLSKSQACVLPLPLLCEYIAITIQITIHQEVGIATVIKFTSIMPVIFWLCWHDENNKILSAIAPLHHAANDPVNIDHHLDRVYQLCLLVSTGVRLLTFQAIAMSE